jgi:hypothetical protein
MQVRFNRKFRPVVVLSLVLGVLLFAPTEGTANLPARAQTPQAVQTIPIVQGAFIPMPYFASSEIDAFNKLIGKDAGIITEFYTWGLDFDDSPCGYFQSLFAHDRTTICVPNQAPGPEIHTPLMLTWMPIANPPNSPGCNLMENGRTNLDAIANGSCDAYIDRFALHLKNWAQRYGDVFLIRFAHEMNITDSEWWANDPAQPGRYIAAFRRVHDRFVLQGATQQYAQFVWSPNYRSNPWVVWNSISNYYPGDAYVDWIGLSGYNWYSAPGHTAPWWTFSDLYDSPNQADPWQKNNGVKVGVLRYLMCHYAKPIILTEIGSVEGPGGTQTKANWIADTYSKLQDFPYVRAITWYNDFAYHNQGAADFRITAGSSYDPNPLHYPGYQSPLSNWTQAYKTAIASSAFTSTLPSLASLTPSGTYCGPIPPVPAPALDAPAFMLARPGDTVSALVSVGDVTTTVTLSVSGLPGSFNASFNPATVGPFTSFPYTATSLMTIHVPGSAALGNVSLTVRATGSGLSLSDLTTLMVKIGRAHV